MPEVQGGAERHCEALYTRLLDDYKVRLFGRVRYRKREVFRWVSWLPSPRSKHLETIVHSFLCTLICVRERPDVVHIHNIGSAFFIPLLRLFHIRTVLTVHSLNYEHDKWGSKAKKVLKLGEWLGLRWANKIITVSDHLKNRLEEKYSRKDIVHIPNGVYKPNIIPQNQVFVKYKISKGEYVLLVGRLTPEKGFHNAVSAYRKIDDPPFKLVIAGGADLETKYAKNLKLYANSNIIFTDYLPYSTLSELYSSAGLFLSTSVNEGFPLSLLEALAHRLPVLVSDIPAHREVDLVGVRYYKGQEELVVKMQALFKYGVSHRELENYEKLLETKYSWVSIAHQTKEVYED